MSISKLMTYAQQLEGDKHSERSKDNKKVRVDKYEYSSYKSGNRNPAHF